MSYHQHRLYKSCIIVLHVHTVPNLLKRVFTVGPSKATTTTSLRDYLSPELESASVYSELFSVFKADISCFSQEADNEWHLLPLVCGTK